MGETPGVLPDNQSSPTATPDREPFGHVLRVGVVGAGMIGGVHAHAARRAGARVSGVATSTPASAARAARRIGADVAFDHAEMLVVSPDIDVVHICTPNHLHVPLAEAALAAGKHVVCEKPLAVDRDQAQRLVELAREAGVVATVPFVYRFYPLVREARARLARGTLGPVRLVHGSYLQDWLATEDDHNWRVDPAAGGASRAFADIGSHWCDLMEFVTGDRLVAVCAELVTVMPERPTEDICLILFRTRNGVSGSLVVSQVSPGRKNQILIEVTSATATLSFDQEQPETLWVGRRGTSEHLVRDPALLDPSAAAYVTTPVGHPQGYQDCFDAFVSDTYRAIGAKVGDGHRDTVIDGLPTFADGARAATITDSVMRSAASGRWEEVPS